MGFFKRLLGLETKPGELQPLTDGTFGNQVTGGEAPPCFVYFFNLWCASCQVMGGLLNEIGPEYLGRAVFFKLDTNKNPKAPARYEVYSVPTVIAFRSGEPVDRLSGLVPLNTLKSWLDSQLQ
jgi:thioredoxin 1